MTTTTIDVREAQNCLPELVSSVETGTEIILTKDNAPVARLVPLAVEAISRVAGLHAGSVWISPDFDRLPPNLQSAFDGDKP